MNSINLSKRENSSRMSIGLRKIHNNDWKLDKHIEKRTVTFPPNSDNHDAETGDKCSVQFEEKHTYNDHVSSSSSELPTRRLSTTGMKIKNRRPTGLNLDSIARTIRADINYDAGPEFSSVDKSKHIQESTRTSVDHDSSDSLSGFVKSREKTMSPIGMKIKNRRATGLDFHEIARTGAEGDEMVSNPKQLLQFEQHEQTVNTTRQTSGHINDVRFQQHQTDRVSNPYRKAKIKRRKPTGLDLQSMVNNEGSFGDQHDDKRNNEPEDPSVRIVRPSRKGQGFNIKLRKRKPTGFGLDKIVDEIEYEETGTNEQSRLPFSARELRFNVDPIAQKESKSNMNKRLPRRPTGYNRQVNARTKADTSQVRFDEPPAKTLPNKQAKPICRRPTGHTRGVQKVSNLNHSAESIGNSNDIDDDDDDDDGGGEVILIEGRGNSDRLHTAFEQIAHQLSMIPLPRDHPQWRHAVPPHHRRLGGWGMRDYMENHRIIDPVWDSPSLGVFSTLPSYRLPRYGQILARRQIKNHNHIESDSADASARYMDACKSRNCRPNLLALQLFEWDSDKTRLNVPASTWVSFRGFNLGDKGLDAALCALTLIKQSIILNVSNNMISSRGMTILCKFLGKSRIVSVDVSNNEGSLNNRGSQALMALLRSNRNIIHVNTKGCGASHLTLERIRTMLQVNRNAMWNERIFQHIGNTILEYRDDFLRELRRLDTRNSGYVNDKLLLQALQVVPGLSRECRTLIVADVDCRMDGKIDYMAFINRFHAVDGSTFNSNVIHKLDCRMEIDINSCIGAAKWRIKSMAEDCKLQDVISFDEFKDIVRKSQILASDQQLHILFLRHCKDSDGVNWRQFLDEFKLNGPNGVTDIQIGAITERKHHILKEFERVDTHCNGQLMGSISSDQFKAIAEKLIVPFCGNNIIDLTLSNREYTSQNNDFTYAKWLSAFSVTGTEKSVHQIDDYSAICAREVIFKHKNECFQVLNSFDKVGDKANFFAWLTSCRLGLSTETIRQLFDEANVENVNFISPRDWLQRLYVVDICRFQRIHEQHQKNKGIRDILRVYVDEIQRRCEERDIRRCGFIPHDALGDIFEDIEPHLTAEEFERLIVSLGCRDNIHVNEFDYCSMLNGIRTNSNIF